MRTFLLVFIVGSFSACFVSSEVDSRRFSFYKADKPLELAIKVPKGFLNEKMKLGDIGKEQFYTYADGSVFFVGLNMTWPTLNQQKNLVPYFADTILIKSGYFKGIDNNGLHYRETWFDHFVVGYAAVKPSKLEQFEKAVHSVRFKRPAK